MDLWAWMERLGQDDHEALEHLLAHYDGMLRYIISGMLSDPQDQEDCLAQIPAVPIPHLDWRRRCFKRSGSSVCRRHWTSCPPGTAPSSTASTTISSPPPASPPS